MPQGHAMKRAVAVKGLVCVVMLALSAVLRLLSAKMAERFFDVYSPFSRWISRVLGMLFSFARFSVAEFVIYIAIAGILASLVITLIHTFTRPGGLWHLLGFLASILAAAGTGLFLYLALWGLNYYAPSCEQLLKLDVRDRPEQALIETSWWLMGLIEDEAGQVRRGDQGQMDAGGFNALSDLMPATVEALMQEDGLFAGGGTSKPKRVTNWILMTYAGISGIYMPFTGESNVNPDTIDAYLPHTMAHEMAHRLGFAREEDANYMAFRTCLASPYAEIRYSGILSALFSCLSSVEDAGAREALYAAVPKAVWDDVNYYWERREDQQLDQELLEAVSSFSEEVNDTYLQTMGQADGVQSYSRVVSLLIADYVSRFGEP